MSLNNQMLSDGEVKAELANLEKDILDTPPIEHDGNFGELVAADDTATIITNDISNETDADASLEVISKYITETFDIKTTDQCILNMTNVAIESICQKVNFNLTKATFSFEDYKTNPEKTIQLALETIKENAALIWASVKEKISLLAKYLGEKMNYFKRNLNTLKSRIISLDAKISALDNNAVPKALILKPQGWFIDLMYSTKGMPAALEGIGKDVTGLLNEHRKMATDSVNKYTKWLLTNYKEAETDPHIFSTLKVNKDEFLLSGAKEFNRSIGYNRPIGDNSFYRGHELPGNNAFYTSIRPTDKSGASAIGMIMDVSFSIKKYDPTSYKLAKIKIAKISAASSLAWIGASLITMGLSGGASAALAVAAMGTSLYSIHNQMGATVEGTGSRLTIDKDMVFKTLSINELKRVSNELKVGVRALQDWYTAIFETNWKHSELDKVISGIIGNDRVKVQNSTGFRSLKRYCVALINLMTVTTVGTHIYAFKTYGAMMNYAEKSVKQYK